MKIFFFGGTFDPPHLGHKMIVDKCIGMCDKLILFPNFKSPHKNESLTLPKHRIKMLKILFKKYDLEINDYEIKSKTDSYTYKTIEYLKKRFINSELTMVIGYDQLLTLNNWYQSDKIFMSVNILCFKRDLIIHQNILKDKVSNIKMKEAINSIDKIKNIKFVEKQQMFSNTSSTYIRNNYSDIVNHGKKAYLNIELIEYIDENNLYEF